MLELTGKIANASIDFSGNVHLTLDVNEKDVIKNSYDKYKKFDCIDIKISKHRECKTKAANNYFHALVREIAGETGDSFDKTKNILLYRYGQPELLDDGSQFVYISKAPIEYMLNQTSLHTYPVGTDGEFTTYAVLRGVKSYSKEEMSKLINGTVSEALLLGIDVYTSSKIDEIKNNWEPETNE